MFTVEPVETAPAPAPEVATVSQPLPVREAVRPTAGRLHLPYLDGLRGCAALFVVLHHAYVNAVAGSMEPVSYPLRLVTNLFQRGQYGVDVFIVLSGYCLMLPLAQSGAGPAGGVGRFLLRRAWRILPGYYGALALCLLVYALVPILRQPGGTRHDEALPAFDVPALLAHGGLVHNLSGAWALKVDPPMWSVATEWQIYFVFALVLVPLWRRFGAVATLAAAVLLGHAPFLLMRGVALSLPADAQSSVPTGRFDSACFWFIGLFALGMVAAEMNFSPARWAAACRRHVPWGWLAGLLGAGTLAAVCLLPGLASYPVAADYFVGLATAAGIVYCTRRACDRATTPLLSLFQSGPAVAVGKFSYSLYLTHWPVLALLQLLAVRQGAGPLGCLLVLGFAGVPLSLGVGYAFYLACERPFLRYKWGVTLKLVPIP